MNHYPSPTTPSSPSLSAFARTALLLILCGLLTPATLRAQEVEKLPPPQAVPGQAIQPPQEPQPKGATPQAVLRQGPPVVYQSFGPCRVVDTRNSAGPFGGPKLAANATRSFSLVPSGGGCGDTLPAGATALAINVTITGTENSGYLTMWPAGQAQPNASVINWTAGEATIANAVIVPVGAGGGISIFSSEATHVILDVSGYFLGELEPGDELSIFANNSGGAAVRSFNSSSGSGMYGESLSGAGLFGISGSGRGVHGQSESNSGVYGQSNSGNGVDGTSSNGSGVSGISGSGLGVRGESTTGFGVYALSTSGTGVFGYSSSNVGVHGTGANAGLRGNSDSGIGVSGVSSSFIGVRGESTGEGVFGVSSSNVGRGVSGFSSGSGVYGTTVSGGIAVHGRGSSWFAGDTTPLNPNVAGPGTGIVIGSAGTFGYISAFDYGVFQPRVLALNNGGGNVGIGTLSPDQRLTVNGGASKPGGGSWATFSDERLKVMRGRFTPGLSAVMQLQPLRYEYKADNALGLRMEGEQVGFGAGAVARVIPEAVTQNERGYLLVNNDPILWAMLNAIKEQQLQIERQRGQIDELSTKNGRISKVEAENATLKKQLEQLGKVVCAMQPMAAMCR